MVILVRDKFIILKGPHYLRAAGVVVEHREIAPTDMEFGESRSETQECAQCLLGGAAVVPHTETLQVTKRNKWWAVECEVMGEVGSVLTGI